MKKLYKLKKTLYIDEESGYISEDKENECCVLFAKKGQLAELKELEEDDYHYEDGIVYKYVCEFIAKGCKYIYSETGEYGDNEWFEVVIR